jgi:hypothetical protein
MITKSAFNWMDQDNSSVKRIIKDVLSHKYQTGPVGDSPEVLHRLNKAVTSNGRLKFLAVGTGIAGLAGGSALGKQLAKKKDKE